VCASVCVRARVCFYVCARMLDARLHVPMCVCVCVTAYAREIAGENERDFEFVVMCVCVCVCVCNCAFQASSAHITTPEKGMWMCTLGR